jgi:DNA-binding Xre family transcriptional regulator
MLKNNIKKLLHQKEASISDFMRATGLSWQTCHALYHDQQKNFGRDTLEALARYFGDLGLVFEYVPTEEALKPELSPGEQIKAWREALPDSPSQREIAERIGIANLAYSRLENGRTKHLTPTVLEALVQVFGDKVKDLYKPARK